MKKNIFTNVFSTAAIALSIAALGVSCDVSTDNMGLGTDETVTEIPLATINVDLASFLEPSSVASRSDDSITYSYEEIFGSIDAITSLLPSGADVELAKLGDTDYVTALVDDLTTDLKGSYERCEDLCETVVDEGYSDILSEISKLSPDDSPALSEDSSDAEIAAAAKSLHDALNIDADDGDDLVEARDEIVTDVKDSIVAEILAADIDQYTMVESEESVPAVTIDQSTLDLFTSNLGEDNNKLYLRVSYDYDLPLTLAIVTKITYALDGTNQTDELIELDSDADTDANGEITEDELDVILGGFKFNTSIEFGTLTTSNESLLDAIEGEKLTIKLSARKRGAIEL